MVYYARMATIIADTHKLIQNLQTKEFTKEQAEGVAHTLQELDLSELATKTDLAQLENSIISAVSSPEASPTPAAPAHAAVRERQASENP